MKENKRAKGERQRRKVMRTGNEERIEMREHEMMN